MPRHNGYARFSTCGTYRYELGGDLNPASGLFSPTGVIRMILWIMLNPSTADAMTDDNTIAGIGRFSEAWGFNRIMVGNLYAYRATYPRDMEIARRQGVDIVGPDNHAALVEMEARARATSGRVMVAWGTGPSARAAQIAHLAHVASVTKSLGQVFCLKTNDDGSPVHPLYQRMDTVPRIWEGMP